MLVEPIQPNTLIAFAAKEGSTATDGDGNNSPFTAALLKHLTTPGLDIRKAFGSSVTSDGGNWQQAGALLHGSLGGNDVTLVPAPLRRSRERESNADVRGDYELAERVGTKEAWDSFIAAHPAGFYTDLAKAQRNKLAAEVARIEATEKARAAAEEQARLANEGAKASEQAKAAAQSKAAEEERLAAEEKKQIEDARLAAVEQARAAQAKAAEDERFAAERLAEKNGSRLKKQKSLMSRELHSPRARAKRYRTSLMPTTDRSGGCLAPPSGQAEPAKSAQPLPQDIPRLLQAELRRVGCKTGEVAGEWNASARRAISSFNDKAGNKLDIRVASLDALDTVKGKTGRVCPLDCERGFRDSGDRCVKITCGSGYVLGANGSCQKRTERTPKIVQQRERRAPDAAGRGKCFVYSGASFCE